MGRAISRLARRELLQGGLVVGGLFFTRRGLFAEELSGTPPLTEGPFYPDKLPLDKDNDLIQISDSMTPAVGQITHLTGRVLDASGGPVKDALVEIWQCDANGVYIHSRDSSSKDANRDKNFQGYGAFTTGESGEYRFRTIKPVPYRQRPAPHIHVKIKQGGKELLTTQLFVRDHAGNARDGIFNDIAAADKKLLLVDFAPIKDSTTGELSARFDVVLGRMPKLK